MESRQQHPVVLPGKKHTAFDYNSSTTAAPNPHCRKNTAEIRPKNPAHNCSQSARRKIAQAVSIGWITRWGGGVFTSLPVFNDTAPPSISRPTRTPTLSKRLDVEKMWPGYKLMVNGARLNQVDRIVQPTTRFAAVCTLNVCSLFSVHHPHKSIFLLPNPSALTISIRLFLHDGIITFPTLFSQANCTVFLPRFVTT